MKKHWDEESIKDGIMQMNVEIPESLKPDQIQKKLAASNSIKKPFWNGKRMGSVMGGLAAILFIVLFIPGMWEQNNEKSKALLEETKAGRTIEAEMAESNETELGSKDALAASLDAKDVQETAVDGFLAVSYDEIYERMQRYYEKYPYTNIQEDIMEMADGGIPQFETGNGDEAIAESFQQMEYSDTNVHVEGVDESNTFKTDGKYFYVMRAEEGKVDILSANREKVERASSITLPEKEGDLQCYYHELYLDGDSLIVLGGAHTGLEYTVMPFEEMQEDSSNTTEEIQIHEYVEKTRILFYDITDRENPELINTLTQDGSYQESRKVDGYLYVYSLFRAQPYVKKEETSYYIPCVDGKEIPEGSIYLLSSEMDTVSYMVMTGVSVEQPDVFISAKAVLADWSQFYVSRNNIYMAGNVSYEKEHIYTTSKLIKFSYSNGTIVPCASAQMQGIIENPYCLDEYQGYLRVVLNRGSYQYQIQDGLEYIETEGDMINGLFIYDETLNLVGSIENIAPGESLKSARFMGDTAYFVTFEQVDPLFSVNLSDPQNPQIIGELKTSGFSEYLHPYGEKLLLGIGYEVNIENGSREGIKLSMFDRSNPTDVKEIDKFVLPSMNYSEGLYNPKIILVDAKKNIIGFGMEGFTDENSSEWIRAYKVFSYDEEDGFTEVISHEQSDYSYEYYVSGQGIYIGDFLYILENDYDIAIYDLLTYEQIGEWEKK